MVITLLLAGCAQGGHGASAGEAAGLPPLAEIAAAANPAALSGPTSVPAAHSAIEPITKNPQPQLPAKVLSVPRTGNAEVIVKSVERIVPLSLTGAVADYVQAYGFANNIVGRDISTSIPGRDEQIPVVTRGGHSVDAESVLSLNPTLVITDGTVGPADVIAQLADAGVAVVYVDPAASYEESYKQAEQVAAALGVPELAEQVISRARAAITAKEAEIARLRPNDEDKIPSAAFLYMRGAGIFYLFGEGSGIDALFASLGVKDVAKQIGWQGQRPMNDEALVSADPQVLVVMTKGLASVGGVDGMLTTHPATALTTAGKNRRVIDVPDTALFTSAVRVPQVLDGLARAFYAPESLPASKATK
ncbi:ABC transporter substrate-binding protein [Canibacter sp. lx-72]|uniref:heme/hemin ABC transporter substrate-binding protein n=1 Tax=Canibacter zhuwentaonis TaxID=2837491 RepID=UPI001BDC910B|nr:ABC transporter substrate-binding protein [Canibacter zhuwentaonis]MBT1018405.1 ABC transporter substrate-binding protein [Canibacter zhuwentaonis]MBT1018750.1 ABC transporter substrate-binding protein [Canibacter zhuwentaonis]